MTFRYVVPVHLAIVIIEIVGVGNADAEIAIAVPVSFQGELNQVIERPPSTNRNFDSDARIDFRHSVYPKAFNAASSSDQPSRTRTQVSRKTLQPNMRSICSRALVPISRRRAPPLPMTMAF